MDDELRRDSWLKHPASLDLVFRLPDHVVNGADVLRLYEELTGAWSKGAPTPPPEDVPK